MFEHIIYRVKTKDNIIVEYIRLIYEHPHLRKVRKSIQIWLYIKRHKPLAIISQRFFLCKSKENIREADVHVYL